MPFSKITRIVSPSCGRLLAIVLSLAFLAQSAHGELSLEKKTPAEPKPAPRNRLGLKTYQPILNVKQIAKSQVEYDLETGSATETITLPSDQGEIVLEVHYWSVLDYLDRLARDKEGVVFSEVKKKYLTGEEETRRQGQKQGIMPEINLPDFMPKSLASIIGEGTGSLQIHGRSTTDLSGTTTYQRPEDNSLFRKQSKFPRLKLEQRQQINIEGTIGTKIHVFVDYNSQNQFENRNRIEVKYVGEEDEILQGLELGDVNLTLPPSMLVSANIPRGNFGIKGQTRLGALTTTFIASKEQGESSKKNIRIPISGEAEATDSMHIWDVNFNRNRHFLLVDTSYIAVHHIKFLDRNGSPLKDEKKRPLKIRVFKDDGNFTNNNQGMNQARPGLLYVDPNNRGAYPAADGEFGFFNELEMNKEYILEQCGIVISFSWVDDKEKIGVIYETVGGEKVGEIKDDTLRMKLIKSATMNPQNPAWPLMLRNVYPFGGGSQISPQTFSVDIFTNETPPRYDEGGQTFLQLFGLDNDGDNKVDRIYVDFTRGLIFFPSLEPFSRPYNSDDKLIGLLDKNRRMYVEDDPSRLNTLEFQKYQLIIRYSRAEGSATKSFELGAMNIVQNSERIYINDRLLRSGADYTIDYQFGQLTLKPGLEIPPNSEIKVNFEQVALFGTGNTSLFGFHNEYEFDSQRRNYLTNTLFFQSIESVDRTFVRLGDEPKTSMLGEVGGKFEFDSELLTSLLNKLPVFESRIPSKINFVGGLAFSNPNPNTRGGVLIEDFETSKIENPRLMMNNQAWRLSSLPKSSDGVMDLFIPDKAGNLFWFDPYNLSWTAYGFYEEDVYGRIEGRTEQNREMPVTVLSVVFEPEPIEGTNAERRESWRSIVQPVSDTGVLGMDERDFMQIYIAASRDQGKLILDFGQVNEDQIRFLRNRSDPDKLELVSLRRLETEDKNFDGRLDYDEDTGLDGVAGDDRTWTPESQDDGNDDFYRTGTNELADGRRLNLTEGNNKGQIGSNFDTEDLNNNGALDEGEHIFRLIIDLKTLELVPPPGIYIPEADRKIMVDEVPFMYNPGGDRDRDKYIRQLGADNWYLLEIPLPKENSRFAQYYQKINNPSLSHIMHVRLTLYDFFKNDTINFAAINFVGNRFKRADEGVVPRLVESFADTIRTDYLWPVPSQQEESAPAQSTGLSAYGDHGDVEITSVNTIFNNEYYPPPTVSATLNKYNRSGRVEDFTAQESALSIKYHDLQRYYEGWSLKAENNQQSYLDYAAMSFYLNGRQGYHDPKPTFFIRIGTDRNNFYEYSTPVDTGWAEIMVPFDGFLSLKDSLQGALSLEEIQKFNLDVKRGPFRIKGNPSLTKISIMAVGIANEVSDIPLSGEVWVDDVRLTKVIREIGFNSKVQAEIQLSDLGMVNVSINARDNKFRNLSESIPRNSGFDYSLGGSLNLDRFTPAKWNLRLPVSIRKSFRRDLPRFHPGSEDVTIQLPANKEKNKTETTTQSFTLSYSKSRGTNLLSRILFDNLNGQLSYNTSRTVAPKNLNSNSSVSGRLAYRASLPRTAEVIIFPQKVFGVVGKVPLPYFLKRNTLTNGIIDSKFRYLPNDFELSTTGNYNRSQRYDQVSKIFRLDSLFNTLNAARVDYRPLTSVQTTYNIQLERNMLETARGSKLLGFNIGNETSRRQQTNLQISPKGLPWLQPDFRYQSDYNNDHSPQYVSSFPKGTDYRKFDRRTTQTASLRFMLPQFRQSLLGVRFSDPTKAKKEAKSTETEQSSSAAYKRTGKEAQKGPPGKGILNTFLFKPINTFLDGFDPFSVQTSVLSRDRWEQMEHNPSFMYQLGLRNIDLATRLRRNLKDETQIDTVDFNSMDWNFNHAYQTGFHISQARLNLTYLEQGNNNHNINGYTFNREKGPELTLDYSNIYIPFFIRGIVNKVDIGSGYQLKKGSRGNSIKVREDSDIWWERMGIESITREENWNPKYRVAAYLGKSGKVMARYQKTASVKRDELTDQNRRAIDESDDDNFTMQYSFSAPHGISLPFLRGLKFQSNVRSSLELRRRISRNITEVLNAIDPKDRLKINRDTEDITITPTLGYDFAQVIGNLSASFNSHKDRKTGITRITITMKVSVQLDF